MKTLTQFKKEMNIDSIDLMQGKGRAFAQVRDNSIVVSKDCDLKKPLFVTPLNNQDTGLLVPNAYVIVNSEVKMLGSL